MAAIGPEERARAAAFTKRGKGLVLIVGTSPTAVLVAASKDAGVDAGATLKTVLAEAGGRGGGSPTLAQGNVPNSGTLDALIAALKLNIPEFGRRILQLPTVNSKWQLNWILTGLNGFPKRSVKNWAS